MDPGFTARIACDNFRFIVPDTRESSAPPNASKEGRSIVSHSESQLLDAVQIVTAIMHSTGDHKFARQLTDWARRPRIRIASGLR